MDDVNVFYNTLREYLKPKGWYTKLQKEYTLEYYRNEYGELPIPNEDGYYLIYPFLHEHEKYSTEERYDEERYLHPEQQKMIIKIKKNKDSEWQIKSDVTIYSRLFLNCNRKFNEFYDLIISMSIEEIQNVLRVLYRFKDRFNSRQFLIKDDKGNDYYLPLRLIEKCIEKIEADFKINKPTSQMNPPIEKKESTQCTSDSYRLGLKIFEDWSTFLGDDKKTVQEKRMCKINRTSTEVLDKDHGIIILNPSISPVNKYVEHELESPIIFGNEEIKISEEYFEKVYSILKEYFIKDSDKKTLKKILNGEQQQLNGDKLQYIHSSIKPLAVCFKILQLEGVVIVCNLESLTIWFDKYFNFKGVNRKTLKDYFDRNHKRYVNTNSPVRSIKDIFEKKVIQ